MTIHSHRHSPLSWIPTLYVAEEIPLVLVSYLSILVFSQLGRNESESTVLSALLMLPWSLKSFFRLKVERRGHYRMFLFLSEFLLFVAFLCVAASLGCFTGRSNVSVVFVAMLFVSVCCVWHSLLSHMYYGMVLCPREQRFYEDAKRISSQLSMIVTYGVLIMFVGFLEVFFRSFIRAWSMAGYLLGGGMLLLLILNIGLMPSWGGTSSQRQDVSLRASVQNEKTLIKQIFSQPQFMNMMLILFLFLLPFSLLFYPRVFFLLALAENGGLGCSLQDVGFAQGTIGVTAFMLGGSLGRYLMRHISFRRLYTPLVLLLTIPSVFYLLMSLFPQRGNMYALCVMTGLTQFCFGVGLNLCRPFVCYISQDRHRSATTLLYVPLVVSQTILPMALSGQIMNIFGFCSYFLLLFVITVVAWIVAFVCRSQVIKILTASKTKVRLYQ